jgi:UDP-glucose:(heptosyl)LPS alpha-1,3-glucosyltransferase
LSRIALIKYRFLGKQGGLEKQAFKIIDELIKRGHEITLISTQTMNYKSIKSIKLPCWAPKGFLTLLEFDLRVKAYLKTQTFDQILALDRTSVHTHIRAGNGCHAAYLNLRKERAKFLKKLSFLINPLHFVLLFLEKRGFVSKLRKKIFVNSELVKNQILNNYSVNDTDIDVIYNGIDWIEKQALFDQWPTLKQDWLNKLKIDPHFIHVVFVGHDFKRKGLEYIIKAMPYVPKIQLLVIGQDKKLPYYLTMVQKLKLADRIIFLDCFNDVTPFYALADALVLPTLYDPFANVTLEALCMGVPVFTTSTNGACEVIKPFAGRSFDLCIATEALISILKTIEPKSVESAEKIRQSVKHLDDSSQLYQLIDKLCKP